MWLFQAGRRGVRASRALLFVCEHGLRASSSPRFRRDSPHDAIAGSAFQELGFCGPAQDAHAAGRCGVSEALLASPRRAPVTVFYFHLLPVLESSAA
jgi:hypothetical protein